MIIGLEPILVVTLTIVIFLYITIVVFLSQRCSIYPFDFKNIENFHNFEFCFIQLNEGQKFNQSFKKQKKFNFGIIVEKLNEAQS